MSKGVFINSIDSFIGQALYQELLGEAEGDKEFELFGTYFNKEDSERPNGVYKMLKMKEKPSLFRKYMNERIDYFVYDLHCGKAADLEWGVKALTKSGLEGEKSVIVISSVLSWGGNPPLLVEDKPEEEEKDPEDAQEKKEETKEEVINVINVIDTEDREEKLEDSAENIESKEDEVKEKVEVVEVKEPPKKEVKYKRVGYNEEDFAKRIPCEDWATIKALEDSLLSLKFENLNIYIICAGIPYGHSESVFNFFFKSAWLQDKAALPFLGEGANLVPTIHIKDLAKIVRKILRGSKPETNYIFAMDQTEDKSFKNIVRSISRGLGNGLTESVESYVNEFTERDFYIDQAIYQKNKVSLIVTEAEYTWQKYLQYDIKLNPSKFIEEDFEWHCATGIPGKGDLLINEFCKYRKLRPLKIILNCVNKQVRSQFADKLSNFFNIPVINYEKIVEVLSLKSEELSEEEVYMKQSYLLLKEKLEFLNNNPDFENEENLPLCDPNEIFIEALKYLLKENACRNRGYVLEGMPVNMEEIMRLYFRQEEIIPEGEEEDTPVNDENPEDNEDRKDLPQKKKKIRAKRYRSVFEKEALPESVITICIDERDGQEIDNIFWEVENFYQENNTEILNLLYESTNKANNIEEAFEVMRVYIERNGRPYNYFTDTDEDINVQRSNFVKDKVIKAEKERQIEAKRQQQKEKETKEDYWRKMEKRIESVRRDKEEVDLNDADTVPTRKFLLLNVMPVLTKGMLEVCKINPIDPIDYLADYLFKNSTD